MRRSSRIVLSVLVFDILALLPVVPISIAPVLPDAAYSIRMKPFFQILWFTFVRPDGVSWQWNSFTYLAVLILLTIGSLVTIWLFYRSRSVPNNESEEKDVQQL